MARNLGTVAASYLQAHLVDFAYFVRISLSETTSEILWLTDRRDGFTGSSIGGYPSGQAWSETDIEIGPLQQSRIDPLAVSWMRAANVDQFWTSRASDLREGRVRIYVAWWDPSNGSFQGSYQVFNGRIDDSEFAGGRVTMALKPHQTPWSKQVPFARMGTTCIHVFKDALSCQYAGADTSCEKTRAACVAKSNSARFGGFDKLPKPGDVIRWTRV